MALSAPPAWASGPRSPRPMGLDAGAACVLGSSSSWAGAELGSASGGVAGRLAAELLPMQCAQQALHIDWGLAWLLQHWGVCCARQIGQHGKPANAGHIAHHVGQMIGAAIEAGDLLAD